MASALCARASISAARFSYRSPFFCCVFDRDEVFPFLTWAVSLPLFLLRPWQKHLPARETFLSFSIFLSGLFPMCRAFAPRSSLFPLLCVVSHRRVPMFGMGFSARALHPFEHKVLRDCSPLALQRDRSTLVSHLSLWLRDPGVFFKTDFSFSQ